MEIKERIATQSGELFLQHGVKNVSMDEIAAKLGMSKRTIYQHFADKEELLIFFLEYTLEQRYENVRKLIKTLPSIVDVFLQVIENHRHILNYSIRFVEDIEKYYPRANAMLCKNRDTNAVAIRDFLNEGVKQGVIRANQNLEVVAFLLLDTNNMFAQALKMSQLPFSVWDLFFTMMTNFIRGISTEKGIKIVDDFLENQSPKNEN